MKEPKDPLYPKGLRQTRELKEKLTPQTPQDLPRPKEKKLSFLDKFLNTDNIKDEDKRKIGIIITTIIILTLVISAYYFLIYEPTMEELNLAKTNKLNELHTLYCGPLAGASAAMQLENRINDANNIGEVEMINILSQATADWKNFHKQSIHANTDKFNRTMEVLDNESKILSVSDALTIVNENNAEVLSTIKFQKPDTVSVPILVSRLQAGAGLISVGSIVDIYTQDNYTNQSEASIKGCTVLSIMRYEQNGEIDSQYSKANLQVNGNNSYPTENTDTFSSNVLEMIKGAIINGYSESETLQLLDNYGVKLSSYERQINLGDLDAEYMLLIEAPQEKVSFILNNMESIVLTIPTGNAPSWMIGEINQTNI